MRGVVIAVVLACIVLIGGAALYSISGRGSSSRLVPLSNEYKERVANGYWQKGADNPKVVLSVYMDFQDTASLALTSIIDQAFSQVGDIAQFRVAFYPSKDGSHVNTGAASKAAEAAGRQGKFWNMYSLMLSHQAEWSAIPTDEAINTFDTYASSLFINMPQYRADFNDSSLTDPLNRDIVAGSRIPITFTPTFLVNGEVIHDFPLNPTALADFLRAHINETSASSSPTL